MGRVVLTHRRVMEIKARLAAATPGPWIWEDWTEDGGSDAFTLTAPPETRENYKDTIFPDLRNRIIADEDQNISEADRDFIAHAPEDIALLLEVVEAAMDHPDFTYDNPHLCKQYWSDDA